jgi:multidrug efflux pump subunit AcrB
MAHQSDAEIIERTHNAARYFVENRQVSWVLLVMVMAWGVWGFTQMPKRKDPLVPARAAVAICPWPGVNAAKVEELVTRKIEHKMAESPRLRVPGAGNDYAIRSVTLDGIAYVYVQLSPRVADQTTAFSDINLRLNSITDLPAGAGPIQFMSDFGDTATLMLTIASPPASDAIVAVRARDMRSAIANARVHAAAQPGRRISVVMPFPATANAEVIARGRDRTEVYLSANKLLSDIGSFQGNGFVGLDGALAGGEASFRAALKNYLDSDLTPGPFHTLYADAWQPIVITDVGQTEAILSADAGDEYTYRELERVTSLIARGLETVRDVDRVTRSGVLPERVTLNYSQERLAAYGIVPDTIGKILARRNVTQSAGMIDAAGTEVYVEPTGEFTDAAQIGDVMVNTGTAGSFYLRDLVTITRGYQEPPSLLNFYTWQDRAGRWRHSKAITLAVNMRDGAQVGEFGTQVDQALDSLRPRLPEDLVIARTSDQPRQVRENVSLFMEALFEAILLVVLVAWFGFRDWRSAALIAVSIPITLAMTFGMMSFLGLDLQQVSIATLIIALGLLVDDPVVAGDAVRHEMSRGHPRVIAAWLGPTKLARPILYATVTNIGAYLPFLLLTGTTGEFLRSLPIVMTCALVSSRVVSMTFIPHLGYYLIRPVMARTPEEQRQRGFSGWYYRIAKRALEHRHVVLVGSMLVLAGGFSLFRQLKTDFFPYDVQYLAYVELWLPNSAALGQTGDLARQAEGVIRRTALEYGTQHPGHDGKPRTILRSITSFVGGGSPRFWFSISPEAQQANYAQLIFEIQDKDDMPAFVVPLQRALNREIAEASVDVQQLQTNPTSHPIEIHIAGHTDIDPTREREDIATLRGLAGKVEAVLRASPLTRRVRDDWMNESPVMEIPIDPDRANMAGITNADIAESASAGLSGARVGTLIDGDLRIPIVSRLFRSQRSDLSEVPDLYVYASSGAQKLPLSAVASHKLVFRTERIIRRDHFRTITVFGFPAAGVYASEVIKAVSPQLDELRKQLPPGYSLVLGGESARQSSGFLQLAMVLLISVMLIFLALVIQFRNAVRPVIVFAAVPYGAVGAFIALWLTDTAFGFMAFLGVASLVGVIVSHVIVLFEFIEEMREREMPLIDGLLDAGIERLRPVTVTIGATVLALVPLAMHGGPLWQPLCYAQIGGLLVAAVVELVLVKVIYATFVDDLHIVKWDEPPAPPSVHEATALHRA